MNRPDLIKAERRKTIKTISWPWVAIAVILLMMAGVLVGIIKG